MTRRTIFWHIGPDDLGTAYLADALDQRREELAAHDVQVAGTPTAWELATAELRHSHERLGYDRAEVDGQLATLARRLWQHKGVSVLSMPGLASATRDQALLALDGIRGADIHLVLVVRDLSSQVAAAYQGELELGATTKLDKYVDRVLDLESDHRQARAFRAGHDVADILRRWTRTVLPANVHVIAADDATQAWAGLMDLVGAPEVTLPDGLRAGQLGPSQAALLREVALGLDDQLGPRGRRTALRDWLARANLPLTAPALVEEPAGLFDSWTKATKKFDRQGKFRTAPAGKTRTPAAGDGAAEALAEALGEIARLQRDNASLSEANVRLDRKRRKHKKRAKELRQQGAA